MSREITPFALRMPPEIRNKVDQSAKENRRSLNAEIVARLEATISIEEALSLMASGCPLHEVGQMLIDLAQERSEAIDDLQQMNLEVHAKDLRNQLSYTDERLDKIESRIEYMIEQFKLTQKGKRSEQ